MKKGVVISMVLFVFCVFCLSPYVAKADTTEEIIRLTFEACAFYQNSDRLFKEGKYSLAAYSLEESKKRLKKIEVKLSSEKINKEDKEKIKRDIKEIKKDIIEKQKMLHSLIILKQLNEELKE